MGTREMVSLKDWCTGSCLGALALLQSRMIGHLRIPLLLALLQARELMRYVNGWSRAEVALYSGWGHRLKARMLEELIAAPVGDAEGASDVAGAEVGARPLSVSAVAAALAGGSGHGARRSSAPVWSMDMRPCTGGAATSFTAPFPAPTLVCYTDLLALQQVPDAEASGIRVCIAVR
jgi:hypothetical protein